MIDTWMKLGGSLMATGFGWLGLGGLPWRAMEGHGHHFTYPPDLPKSLRYREPHVLFLSIDWNLTKPIPLHQNYPVEYNSRSNYLSLQSIVPIHTIHSLSQAIVYASVEMAATQDRRSLADRLNGLADNPDDEFALETFEEIFDVVEDGTGFRWTAPTTQQRQDLHLREFVRFFKASKGIPKDTPDDEVKARLFSLEKADFLRLIKGYIMRSLN